MACDKPSTTSDCTNVSPCGAGCGCSEGTTPTPVLPKCQDVALTSGTFANATVTVNAQGCISAVAAGAPELYTPDECCGGSGGGGGTAGARGPKGDPGAAATIDVEQVIGTGTTWSVENIGTSSAAIFKFTAPAASSGGGSSSGGGATGTIGGLEVINGLVKVLPSTLVSGVTTEEVGSNTDKFELAHSVDAAGAVKITLNIDALYDTLSTRITQYHNEQQVQINALIGELVALTNRVTTLEAQSSSTSAPGYGFVNGTLYNSTSAAVTFDISGQCLNTSVAVAANSYMYVPMLPPGQCNNSVHFIKVNGAAVGVYDPFNEIVAP